MVRTAWLFLFFCSLASNAFSKLMSGEGPERRPAFPYISGDTFRYCSDFVMDERYPSIDPDEVQEGNTIFLKTDFLPQFFQNIHPKIKNRYILITHNSDYPAPREFGSMLDDPKLITWYGQNVENYSHPKLKPIPIGIGNRYVGHGNISLIKDAQASCVGIKKTTLLYMAFSIWTCSYEREPVYNLFKELPFCTNATLVDSTLFLPALARSKFVLSPRGNGVDTHRTWEAMLMGSIPIVRSSALDPVFEDLPVLLINDWTEVTEEFLEKKWIEMSSKEYRLDKLYAAYWINLVFPNFIIQEFD